MNKRVALSELSHLILEKLRWDGEVILKTSGCSMFPMLYHRGDKVCLVKPQQIPLKKFDIPLYVRKDGKFILHRIVAVKAEGYVVVGDNQYFKEYPVLASQVLGVVKGFWRNGKYTSCSSLLYRVYCRSWVFGYPVRLFFYRGKQLLYKGIKLMYKL